MISLVETRKNLSVGHLFYPSSWEKAVVAQIARKLLLTSLPLGAAIIVPKHYLTPSHIIILYGAFPGLCACANSLLDG